MKENVVVEKSYRSAVMAVKFCAGPNGRRVGTLRRQFLEAATSVGANVEEAQAARSRADFISKMSIAAKESRESNYWLRLFRDSDLTPPAALTSLLPLSEELIRLTQAIVHSAEHPRSTAS
ncbi:MAG: four helix bundle protein [Planctomycetes bacterium]|nr:four helix bundle protein [Planctomycetota bacterium]